jgi:hypothetical protein
VVRAVGLGLTIVVTYAVITLAGLDLYWVEFGLMVVTVIGIGAVVAHAGVEGPFLKAAVVSFVTALCIEAFGYVQLTTSPPSAQPAVLPPTATMVLAMVALSLMIGGMAGAIALGIRSLQGRGR